MLQTATNNSPKPLKASLETGGQATQYKILFLISLVHLFNDTIQAIVPAILPILKSKMTLSYLQAGAIFFTLNMTSSLLQPVIGFYSDRRPVPYMLPVSMICTFIGILGLALSPNFYFTLLSVLFMGLGSAIFHPESSRVAFLAAGKRRGFAQSLFQVGGNLGQSFATIMTILIFVPLGQIGALWFTIIIGIAIFIQFHIAGWYKDYLSQRSKMIKKSVSQQINPKKQKVIRFALILIVFLLFVRTWYHSAISVYYPFELMDKFGLSLNQVQMYIFTFAVSGAIGTFFGGPLSDKYGRKTILFLSMAGSIPFSLVLPFSDPFWAYIILLFNGFILMSGWSVTVVYAQELVPGKIGTVAGLTTGLSFGLGAVGAVALGGLIDLYSLSAILKIVSFLPFIGLVTFFLPSDRKVKELYS
ncbi:MFS transporter [Metabacillus fastidiosus]|uniref:MFS transporter n=1 Tax=Metabacillus fastidiosus TaxID=1458 RepID=UPI003D269A92